MNQDDTVKLTLSGSILTGFFCNVPRSITTEFPEYVMEVLRRELVKMTETYNMWQLTNLAKTVKLHIHVPYDINSHEIWVCTCTKI